MNVWRPLETVVTHAARAAWPVFQAVNRRFEGKSFQPSWAPAPLLKSWQRSKPPLGWPRTTDSLCPDCVKDARRRILSGEQSVESLVIVDDAAPLPEYRDTATVSDIDIVSEAFRLVARLAGEDGRLRRAARARGDVPHGADAQRPSTLK